MGKMGYREEDQVPDIHFIINPVAGNSGSRKIWEKLAGYMDQHGIPYHYHFSQNKGHAVELARELAGGQSRKLIIAIGGDGTIHEVINGAADFQNTMVSFIPAGSGNDFARGFQIDRNPVRALQELLHNRIPSFREIDLGFYETSNSIGYFVNNLGVGMDAAISEAANQSRWKKVFNMMGMGKLVYLYLFLVKWITYQPTDLLANIDGAEFKINKAWFFNVSNQPFFGGGICISPQSKPDDGLFHMIAVHQMSRWKLAAMFITVFWGGHLNRKEVLVFTGRDITISSFQKTMLQVDGEYVGENDYVRIQMQEQKLKIAAFRE